MSEQRDKDPTFVLVMLLLLIMSVFVQVRIEFTEIRDLQRRIAVLEQRRGK